jgi:hypothetical protein
VNAPDVKARAKTMLVVINYTVVNQKAMCEESISKAPSKVIKPIPTSVRFDPPVKAAIEKAAKDDARSESSLIQKVMSEWLRERKYLK